MASKKKEAALREENMELKKKLRSVSRKLATSKAKLQKEKEENEALKKTPKVRRRERSKSWRIS